MGSEPRDHGAVGQRLGDAPANIGKPRLELGFGLQHGSRQGKRARLGLQAGGGGLDCFVDPGGQGLRHVLPLPEPARCQRVGNALRRIDGGFGHRQEAAGVADGVLVLRRKPGPGRIGTEARLTLAPGRLPGGIGGVEPGPQGLGRGGDQRWHGVGVGREAPLTADAVELRRLRVGTEGNEALRQSPTR